MYALLNYWIKITENTFPINLTQSINLQLDACSFKITVPQYEQFIELNSNWQLRLKIEKKNPLSLLKYDSHICIGVATTHVPFRQNLFRPDWCIDKVLSRYSYVCKNELFWLRFVNFSPKLDELFSSCYRLEICRLDF